GRSPIFGRSRFSSGESWETSTLQGSLVLLGIGELFVVFRWKNVAESEPWASTGERLNLNPWAHAMLCCHVANLAT
ncbi:unnamed protein product, partial [Mesocestoides corti]|uniref:DUF5009 domain-containing protein n=1 Tax=Mesocestoides corti TaxID=53468 RepID=A0A0R3U641_MESCO